MAFWFLAAPVAAGSLDAVWEALDRGDVAAAEAAAEVVRAAATTPGARWDADLALAEIAHLSGDDGAALARLEPLVAEGRQLWTGQPERLVEPLMMLGYSLSETGDTAAGFAASAEALRLARQVQDADLIVASMDAFVRDLLNAGETAAAERLAGELVLLSDGDAADPVAARLLLALARIDLGAPERALAAVAPLLPLDPGAMTEDQAALLEEFEARIDEAAGAAADPQAAFDGWLDAAARLAEDEAQADAAVLAALDRMMTAREAEGAAGFDRAARDLLPALPADHVLLQAADLALLTAALADGRPDLAATWAARVAAVPAPVLATQPQDMLPPLRDVAAWLNGEGRQAEALHLAAFLAELSPLRDGPSSDAVGRALLLLATVQIDMGHLAEARATLDLLNDGAGFPPQIAVLVRLEQAALHARAGRGGEAGAALAAALGLLDSTVEGDVPAAWIRVLTAIADHHAAGGDHAAALEAARRLVTEVSARAGPASAEATAAAHHLALRQFEAGQADAAASTLAAIPAGAAMDEAPRLRIALLTERVAGVPARAAGIATDGLVGLPPGLAPIVEAAQAMRAEGRLDAALGLMDEAIGALPDGHPVLAALLAARGLMRYEAGQDALADLRRATAELSQPDRRDEAFSRAAFAIHVAAAMAAAEHAEGVARLNLLTEAFQVAQRVNDLHAGEVLGRATARLYGADDLGRRRETAAAELGAAQATLMATLAAGADSGEARRRLTRARTALQEAEADLGARFPDYGAFARARPVDLLAARELLAPDEALILFATAEGAAVPGRVFVVTGDGFDSAELAPRAELVAIARRLRCAAALTDPSCAVSRRAATRGTFSLTENEPAGDDGFDPEPAIAAWQALLAPVADTLADRRHLIVVPDRALVALPFHLIARGEEGGRIDWLIRSHAITVMPNVAGLARLRDADARPVAAGKPFLGIGDPLIGTARQGALPFDCGGSPQDPVWAVSSGGLGRGADGLADPARIADLPALPDTRCELERAARLFGTPDALLLQDEAREARVKALSRDGALADYRVLSFATHGLIAGEIGAGDAALVLTPPDAASAEDDGLLTAAEIALLRLDAELVILSACNTAAGSGAEGEGLSGLAAAFFLAGARSLLVSHWPVYSDAATRLTEAMLVEAAAAPEIGRPEALRRAMLDLADAPGADARQRHPAYWAPFTIVGESGAGRAITQGRR